MSAQLDEHVREVLGDAIPRAFAPGGTVTRWIVIAEIADEPGARRLRMHTSPGFTPWDAAGALHFALSLSDKAFAHVGDYGYEIIDEDAAGEQDDGAVDTPADEDGDDRDPETAESAR